MKKFSVLIWYYATVLVETTCIVETNSREEAENEALLKAESNPSQKWKETNLGGDGSYEFQVEEVP